MITAGASGGSYQRAMPSVAQIGTATSSSSVVNNMTWAPQMPIYTTNSPTALQDSMAVLQALAAAVV
jgi:hypothetical protein